MEKMRENFKFFGGMAIMYAVIFTFSLYRNFTGVTFPFYVLATILFAVLFLKKLGQSIKLKTYFYFVGMFLLGIATMMTASGFFHFFNWVGISLLFMSAMIHQWNDDRKWGFPTHLKNFFVLIGRNVISVIAPFVHCFYYVKGENQDVSITSDVQQSGDVVKVGKKRRVKRKILPVLLGLGLSLVSLVIVLPLLLSSDMVFEQLFRNIFASINFIDVFGVLFTFGFAFIVFYGFFAAMERGSMKGPKEGEKRKADAVIGITFTMSLAVVYLIYSVIQILFLFLRFEGGLPEHVTYSQYAHSGFWQLLAVSIINFVLVLICIRVFRESKVLKALLCMISFCTCIMTVSAAYRMLLYVGAYNLSFLRVLVLWFLAVLTLIMVGVMIYIFKTKFGLFQYIVVVVACAYIIFSFARVDYIIAGYNIEQNVRNEDAMPLDVHYLTRWLSVDAAPAIARLQVSDLNSNKMQDIEDRESFEAGVKSSIDRYFEQILEQENTGRRWNFSRHLAQKAAQAYLE